MFIVLVFLPGVLPDEEGFGFGIHDQLFVVQPTVPGEHVGSGNGQGYGNGPHAGEQLVGQQNRGEGTVGDAAEHGHHAGGGAKRGGQAQQGRCGTAEGGADEEGGNDLAALVPGPEGEYGEENLEQEGPWGCVSRHGPGDHIHTGAVVVSGAHQQCEQHHQSAADQHPHPPVGGQLGIAYAAQLHGVAEQGRHQSAQDAQGQQLYQCERMKGRYALDDQCVGRDAEKTGHQQ